MERDQRDSRTSTMNFGERLWTPDNKQIRMNGSWVPITPEKPILTRSHHISALWQENEMRIENLQEIVVPGSGYINEMMHYNRPDQNLHLGGHTGKYNSFDGGSSERNRIINQIAGSYPQDLQYVMNFDVTTSMAGGRALLPSFHPLAGTDGRYFSAGDLMLNQSNNYSFPESMYKDMNTLIPTINSEFDRSRSNSFLNNIHYSVSNPLKNGFSDTLHGWSYTPCRPEYDLNSTPVTEADPALDFNSLQSMPLTINNQVCTVLEHTIAESASPEKDMQGNLIASTDNNIQDYCNGLLQNIVDSSSAAIATPQWVRNDSENNNCGEGSGLGFDLNKTPDQKAPKRRKHRPKVVVEGKGKRTKRAPIQKKTESTENPPRKRKYVGKNAQKAATTQADVIIENADSSATTRKLCQRALNFDLEESRSESKRKVTVQQEVQHRNKAFKIISDNQASEPLVGTNIMCGRNSALLINEQDGVLTESQQARPTDGLTLVLNQKSTDTLLPERQAAVALSETTEQQYIENLLDAKKNSDYGNCDLYQGRVNGCIQQHIHTEGIGNIHFQSERNYEVHQNTNALLSQKTLQLVPNIQSNSCEERVSKRKHYHVIENQDVSANNSLGSSFLCPEIFQVEESSNGTTMDKGFLQTQKRKKTENRIHTSVSGSSSYQIISEGITRKVRRKGKEKSQSQFNDELSNCQIESKRLHGKQNVASGKCTGDNFTDSGAPNQTYPTTIDEIICRLNNLNLREGNTLGMDEQSALVPYMGAGSVVPLELEKKRKPRPRVDLDPETERMWRLLMGKEGSEGLKETDEEKEKWWEEERKVFRGRANSFIAQMHLVQGNRRFSQWKGSVVDSVIGVFLTQNVSDHLSSSAFLSLAARFPLNSTSNRKACTIIDTNQLVEDPEVCIVNPDDTIILYGRLLGQSSYYEGSMTPNNTINGLRDTETSGIKGSLISSSNQSSEEEIISSQDSFDSSITQGTGGFRSCSGSNSEEEGPTTSFKHSKTQFTTTANSSQVEKTTMFQEFYNIVNGVSLFSERTKDIQVQDAKCAKQNSRSDRDYGLNSHPISSNSINSGNPKKPLSVGYSTDYELNVNEAGGTETFEMLDGKSSWTETFSIVNELQDTSYARYSTKKVGGSEYKSTEQQYGPLGTREFPTMNPYGSLGNHLIHLQDISQSRSHTSHYQPSKYHIVGKETLGQEGMSFTESLSTCQELGRGQDDVMKVLTNKTKHRGEGWDRISAANRQMHTDDSRVQLEPQQQVHSSGHKRKFNISNSRKEKFEKEKKNELDWDNLRKQVQANGGKKERSKDTMDSLDYEAVRCASVKEISEAIKERGMNNMLAERIQELLNRLVAEHGSIDLEWLRDVPPDKAKDYLLSIRGLGLKSVECVRLLTLHHLAFPVDTNVGRIAVRLGWVPLQPLPESLQLHLLELYPILESIQKYLWPRLCKLDQKTLYELHYQMITFGKVFCTKSKPNCNACPLRAECRHFASAFASARLALPGPEEKHIVSSTVPIAADRNTAINLNPAPLPLPANNLFQDASCETGMCEPIIEEPATPEQDFTEAWESDIEDSFYEDPDEIPTIKISMEEMTTTIQNYIQGNMQIQEGDMSKALVALNPEATSIPAPKLKNVSRLRTEHQVYEIPDAHPLLEKMDKREPDDPSPYLLAIWTPGEMANSVNPPERRCQSQDSAGLCNDITCFLCNSIREANSQTVRGTLLIPCRTATRGSFPLNGTYFQVNELFADHASSIEPLDVPREWLWNLPRRTVYFGTSVSAILRGLSTQEIQQCFWRGFVCVRGFDRETRSPRPLMARLHYPASKLAKAKK